MEEKIAPFYAVSYLVDKIVFCDDVLALPSSRITQALQRTVFMGVLREQKVCASCVRLLITSFQTSFRALVVVTVACSSMDSSMRSTGLGISLKNIGSCSLSGASGS